jgi:hypothetical protein
LKFIKRALINKNKYNEWSNFTFIVLVI